MCCGSNEYIKINPLIERGKYHTTVNNKNDAFEKRGN